MDITNFITIYASIKEDDDTDPDKLLLLTTEKGLSFISGKQKSIDGSSIYSAARIFIKKILDGENACPWHSLLFQKWLKKFTECELIRHDDGHIVFAIELNSNDLPSSLNEKIQILGINDLKTNFSYLYDEYEQILNDIKQHLSFYQNTQRKKNNFILLNCEPNPVWDLIYDALYQGHWKNKAEKWKTYYMRDLEWPTQDELENTQGIVISGSTWSVYDSKIEVIPILMERLRKLIQDFPKIKILGVCFGCQVLAQALGGKVGKMKLENKPMIMNREEIVFMNNFYQKYANEQIEQEVDPGVQSMFIIECHGDHIEVLPNEGTIYCTSENTRIEIFGIRDNILGFQGHPEFTKSIVLDFILTRNKTYWESYEDLVQKTTESVNSGPIDIKLMDDICVRFLH